MSTARAPSHPRPAEPPLLTGPFVALMYAPFLQGLGYASMVLLPVYLDFLGATRGQVGLFMAAGSVGGLLSRPGVGWALDRFRREHVLLVGTAILAIGVASIGWIDRLEPLLWVSRFLVGIGSGVRFTGDFTMAGDLIPVSRRTEGIALFGVSGLLPLAANALVGRIGIEPSALAGIYPIVATLLAGLVLFLIPLSEPPRDPSVPPVPLRETLRALGTRKLWPERVTAIDGRRTAPTPVGTRVLVLT